MIAGRKLLLADDSIAIQKVIDLTFTDEGMEVMTAGDGQDALEKLHQCRPDVVLADVFMPGVDGYALCRYIKDNKRFDGVPVVLLVGSFEPFDEAEAKRAGADDVVTKPFQSIRDLVSRVGSLVSHDDAARPSVLNLDQSEETLEGGRAAASLSAESMLPQEPSEPQVKVFVEAPSMEPDATVLVEAPVMEVEPAEIPEHTCPPVIDLQTADTKRLEPISAAATAPVPAIELQAANEPVEVSRFEDEGVLDLGDVDSFASSAGEDDFVLDVEVEPIAFANVSSPTETEEPFVAAAAPALPEFEDARETVFESVDEPKLTRITDEPVAETSPVAPSELSSTSELSPVAIEAISKRVVEQLSDKVVREIAWEVIPELSELLIKRRLDEQR